MFLSLIENHHPFLDHLKEKHFSIFHFYILKVKSDIVFCFKKLKMKIEFSENKIE